MTMHIHPPQPTTLFDLPPADPRTAEQERWNALTHGVGVILSLIGGYYLMGTALRQGDPYRVVGCGLFVFHLVAVYIASTLSHLACTPRWKALFRMLDQAFIYLLIVATYTPFSLAFLRTPGWLAFLGCLWALALAGFVSKLCGHRVNGVAVSLYVALGWLPIVSAPTLMGHVPPAALAWMLAGGVFYTSGTLLLVNDHKAAYMHALWHVFVLAGSGTHFFAIWSFVAAG